MTNREEKDEDFSESDGGQTKVGIQLADEEDNDCVDDDYIVDEDKHTEDVDVDMQDFDFNIDPDVEFMGTAKQIVSTDNDQEFVNLDVVNNDDFEIGSEQQVSNTCFFLGQEFGSKADATKYFKIHAVETRRQLVLTHNDKKRVRGKCLGVSKKQLVLSDVGSVKLHDKVKAHSNEESLVGDVIQDNCVTKKDPCPWVIHISKEANSETWKVRTLKDEHECGESRFIKQCTYDYLASQLVDQLPSNPTMPTKAVQHQLQAKNEVNVSKSKAYRALKKALSTIQGDYHNQYGQLRDYLEELKRSNPGTTTRVETEQCDPDLPTRVFKRVYICLGPLKKGFQALGRDLLGLDGAFMKQPAVGQLLTAVALDSNNGIYPVAYALVEKEHFSSWDWFLECLGDDLGLDIRSNFTFISDRQKGLIKAIETRFPSAEHRYCLRHLHENMKKKKWNGLAYKQHLWKCATATTIPEFEKCMSELKEFNDGCYKYLLDIHPHSWARSHFTGRAITDVLLNNMCEILNRWLVEGRDKPIITSLEYVREYLMKRIVTVTNRMTNCEGPLTPTATKVYEKIKRDAGKCNVLWNGNHKYQVNGPHNDQCVVDMEHKVCACRRWELNGMPCMHAVAVLNIMEFEGEQIGALESWVNRVHWLSTWKKTYTYTINPLNGSSKWPKSTAPTTLLPPKIVATTGRPKKNRIKGFEENESLNKGGKLSKKGGSNRCGKCREFGHNARRCINEGNAGGSKRKPESSGSGTKTKKKAKE